MLTKLFQILLNPLTICAGANEKAVRLKSCSEEKTEGLLT